MPISHTANVYTYRHRYVLGYASMCACTHMSPASVPMQNVVSFLMISSLSFGSFTRKPARPHARTRRGNIKIHARARTARTHVVTLTQSQKLQHARVHTHKLTLRGFTHRHPKPSQRMHIRYDTHRQEGTSPYR
jgi:hypothetical protein